MPRSQEDSGHAQSQRHNSAHPIHLIALGPLVKAWMNAHGRALRSVSEPCLLFGHFDFGDFHISSLFFFFSTSVLIGGT